MADRQGTDPDAGGDRGSGGEAELKARLDRLGKAIAGVRANEAAEPASADRSAVGGIGQAMKLSSEFIAGVAVGGVIGGALDYFLGTGPFGLVVFVLLGFAAGALNLVRSSQRMSGSQTGRDGRNPTDDRR